MERLKKNRQFRRVYKNGKSIATRYLVIYYYENKLQINRVGFSISKKVGKAVVRNKLRRRLKEIIRNIENYNKGYDLIFIARKPIVNLEYEGIKKNVLKLLKKSKVI